MSDTPNPGPLVQLRDGPDPPPGLEDRIGRALRDRGLLRNAPGTAWRALAAIAASLLLFIGGVATGRFTAEDPRTAAARHDRYLVILWEGPAYREAPAGHEMERVEEYRRWARATAETGITIDGEKLTPDGLRLTGSAGPDALNADPSRDLAITGYFTIEAPSLDRALAIARGCPHIRHGGEIELRKVDPT